MSKRKKNYKQTNANVKKEEKELRRRKKNFEEQAAKE